MEILAVVLAVAGLGVGYGGSTYVYKKNNAANEDRAAKELAKAKKEAEKLVQVAREDAARIADEARKDEKLRRGELKDLENRLVQREAAFDKKLDELDRRTENLRKGEDEVDQLKNEIRDIRTKQQEKLEKIAKLDKKEAAEKLMQMTERDIRGDLTGLVAKLGELGHEARKIASDIPLCHLMSFSAASFLSSLAVFSSFSCCLVRISRISFFSWSTSSSPLRRFSVRLSSSSSFLSKAASRWTRRIRDP